VLVDLDHVGRIGVVTNVAGAGLFGDAIFHRYDGGLIVEVTVLPPLLGEPVGSSHLLPKSAVGDHGDADGLQPPRPSLGLKLL
jgi:hypothetical protein